MPEVVISEFMDPPAVESLRAEFDVLFEPALVDRPSELAAAVATARALVVRNRTEVRGSLLAAARKLEVVGRLGVGLDNIDVAACQARGIAVCPATGANADTVAEYVIAGVFMLMRGAYHASAAVAAGTWPRTDLIGRDVAGKTLGLVGFGATARAAARRAGALGLRVVAFDPQLGPEDPVWRDLGAGRRELTDLLGEADIVSLHVPLTAGTRHLVDARAIGRMKPGAVLINPARGGVVDEQALASALSAGRLAGAMLDVFEEEPLSAKNAFVEVPNLILTPHIAGVTVESNARVGATTAENVLRVLRDGGTASR